mgnify:CR=1 FL=1
MRNVLTYLGWYKIVTVGLATPLADLHGVLQVLRLFGCHLPGLADPLLDPGAEVAKLILIIVVIVFVLLGWLVDGL